MEPNREILREWAPMTEIINQISSRVQSGLFTKSVSITAIDAIPEFLALGTNVGLIFWYNRQNGHFDKLKCEASDITCVKIVSTVEYMVASGHSSGQITIFQIPKSHPDSLPANLRPKYNQKIERYSVTERHYSPITSLEWAPNGMKLFSGDKNGLVVLYELDYTMHLCKESEVVNEAYEIVQLCYYQKHLLVSTTYRNIICSREEHEKWKVIQIGKKDRKALGNFGGTFWKTGLKPTDFVAYCCRPGLRVWLANTSGVVQKTLLFDNLITHEIPEVPLLNPISPSIKLLKADAERTFGQLVCFANKYLLTYDINTVYILDPDNLEVVWIISELRSVLSVACTKEEIFILEGERSLIRISWYPEKPVLIDGVNEIPTASSFLPISDSLKDITSKLQTTSIISALPAFLEPTITECSIQTDENAIVNAEEALETYKEDNTGAFSNQNESQANILPNTQNFTQMIVSLLPSNFDKSMYVSEFESPQHSSYVNGLQKNNEESIRKLKLYEKIGEENFDSNILYKHIKRKKASKKTDSPTNINNRMTTSCDSALRFDADCEKTNFALDHLNLADFHEDFPITPDLRSPDSIQNDIKSKEKLLADLLQFTKFESVVVEPSVHDVDSNKENSLNTIVNHEILEQKEIPQPKEFFSEQEKKQKMPVWVQINNTNHSTKTKMFDFLKKKKSNNSNIKKRGSDKIDDSDSSFENIEGKRMVEKIYESSSLQTEVGDEAELSISDWEIV